MSTDKTKPVVIYQEILGEVIRAVLLKDGVIVDGPFLLDSLRMPSVSEGHELLVITAATSTAIGARRIAGTAQFEIQVTEASSPEES